MLNHQAAAGFGVARGIVPPILLLEIESSAPYLAFPHRSASGAVWVSPPPPPSVPPQIAAAEMHALEAP